MFIVFDKESNSVYAGISPNGRYLFERLSAEYRAIKCVILSQKGDAQACADEIMRCTDRHDVKVCPLEEFASLMETFKQDCECAGVEYHPRPAKTYIYEHPNAIFKVTLDENDVIDQVFMRTNGDWKSLRANQAKCATFLYHVEEVAAGESFGLYTRIHV